MAYMKKRLMIIFVGLSMGWSMGFGFLEDRVYCQVDDGALRVSLEEGGDLCHEYQNRLYAAQSVAERLAGEASMLAGSSTLEVDRQYREEVQDDYQLQSSKLSRFSQQIVEAIESYEKVVLIRVQGYLSRTMKLTTLGCQNKWKTFKTGYTSSRYPLCRMGQEHEIRTLQTTDDLDEFAETLQSYVARHQKIVDSWK